MSKKKLRIRLAYLSSFLCISFSLSPTLAQIDQSSPVILHPVPDQVGFGHGVASGDVNGDGISDIIAGSVLSTAGGATNAGLAFVFFGGSPPNTMPDFALQSPEPEAQARFGWDIAVGDVNGDGFGDIIVSALLANGGTNGRGEAYVFFGGLAINAQADVTLQSPSDLGPSSHFGWSIGTGDINGDGIEDVIVGAETVRVMGNDQAGEAFVYFGRRPFTGALGLTLRSPNVERAGSFGNAVAVADFNKDGFEDVAIAAPGQTVGGTDNAGHVFIFFGGPSFDASADLTLQDANPRKTGRFGFAIAAGDVNGDGFQDLVVGATNPPPPPRRSPTNEGEVHVFFGGTSMHSTFDTKLTQRSVDGFGSALAVADVDRDGKGDIIVGVPTPDLRGGDAGQVRVFLNRPSLDDTADFILQTMPPERGDLLGDRVTAGDFNGDRRIDVIAGAPNPPPVFGGGGGGPGKVVVFLGR
ncbi:MAG: FG-GAP repeat protein [Acidobacteria bacterium]|nr:FG-GAP repeat protein [Acidobacteriota bacterium]